MVLRGFLKPEDAPAFLDALNRDPNTQRPFIDAWVRGRAHRLQRVGDLARWFWEHRELIMRIVSIALLFANPAPKQPEPEPEPVPKRPRVRKRFDKGPLVRDVTEELNDQ